MNLTFHWINILILIGAFNALVFCVVLLFERRHPGAGFLAAFVFVFAYNGFETFNWSSGLDRYYMFFDLFPFIVIYAIGPSLYLYILSVLYPERKPAAMIIVAHYGMVIFQFVTRSVVLVVHFLQINHVIDVPFDVKKAIGFMWLYSEPLSVVVFLAYLGASVYRFRIYKRDVSSKVRDKQKSTLRWINFLLWCLMTLGIAWTLTVTVFYFESTVDDATYYPVELGLVLFVYWLVFNGYDQL